MLSAAVSKEGAAPRDPIASPTSWHTTRKIFTIYSASIDGHSSNFDLPVDGMYKFGLYKLLDEGHLFSVAFTNRRGREDIIRNFIDQSNEM